MSQIKLTADSGGGTVALKAPASTTSNSAFELTLPGTGNRGLGKILQVVEASTSTQVSNTNSAAYVDGGLQAQITPSSTSSKVFITFSTFMAIVHTVSGASASFGGFRLLRDSTAIYTCIGNSTGIHGLGISPAADSFFHVAHTQLDSPSTTSQLTYKIQIRPYNAGHTMYANGTSFGSPTIDEGGLMQLWEVAA